MRYYLTYLSVICGVVFLAFQSATAQPTARPLVMTSIAIESTVLRQDNPAVVTVTIENISGAELDLSSSGSFHLASLSKEARARNHQVIGDVYWSPVNLSNGTPKEIIILDGEKPKEETDAERAARGPIRFAKDETKTFKVDLTKVFWSPSMSSMWPDQPLFKIVKKGSYALSLSLRNPGVDVESNPLEVSVK